MTKREKPHLSTSSLHLHSRVLLLSVIHRPKLRSLRPLLSRNTGAANMVLDTGIAIRIQNSDLALEVSIQLLRLEQVQIQRETPRDHKPDEGNTHSNLGIPMICHDAKNRWEDRASRDTADNEGRAALGVATETAQGEGEDCGEDAGFEEEDEGESGDASVALGDHGADDEDDDHGHEEPEDLAGF